MNTTTKKIVVGVLGATVMLSMGVVAIAENTTTTNTQATVKMDQKMVLEIGPSGRTLLRGTVSAVGTNSLTVKSWGGDWMINVSGTTKLAPRTDMAQFQVGDFVGVQGITSQSALWTVDATLVRNWTERKEIKTEVKERKEDTNSFDVQAKIQSILEQIKKIQAQISTQAQY